MRVSIFHNLSGQESIDQVVADLDDISTGGFRAAPRGCTSLSSQSRG